MAYCRNCGNWIQDTAARCNVCGTEQAPRPQPQQPQYQQPQYQPPQYQPPQYQPPKQEYPNTWDIPKTGGRPTGGYPQSQEIYPQQPAAAQPQGTYSQQFSGADDYMMTPPAKPPKKSKKKLVILLVVLGVLLAAILGIGAWLLFGGSGSDDDVLGRYDIISCRDEDGAELETNDEWILLAKGGKATLSLDGESFSAKWKLDDDDLTITQDGDEYTGSLRNGILTLDLDGVTYTFGKDGARPSDDEDARPAIEPAPAETTAPDEETEPTEAPGEAPVPIAPAAPGETEGPGEAPGDAPAPSSDREFSLEWWEGDWYGWWIIYEGEGDWAEAEDVAFDVCGRINVDPSTASGHISLWDQDEGNNKVRWEVDLAFVEGYDDRGIMCSETGSFWGESMPVGNWYVDPTEYPYCEFENFICIQGTYEDSYGEGFTYYIFLRPWGTRWEDIRSGDMSDMPYTDMMPVLYDGWYLPLINAGKSMPNDFN